VIAVIALLPNRGIHMLRLAFVMACGSASPQLASQTNNVIGPVTGIPEVIVNAGPISSSREILGPAFESGRAMPAQVQVFGDQSISQPGPQNLARLLTRDPSVSENYATTGYYENFSIRGFTLDHGSAYRINGFVVPGEYHVTLDNKESVELLKGAGTLGVGAASPGGMINFITRRPVDVSAARLDVSSRGGSYLAVDLGVARSATSVFGLRLSAAHEEMRPFTERSDGQRDFVSLSLDSQPTSALHMDADLEFQRRSQRAVPGFQLLGGTRLPEGVGAATNINQQSWSRPVQNAGTLASMRATYTPNSSLEVRAGVGVAQARIEDNQAFPYGCNTAPFQYFCSDGGYVLYDYHASELRRTKQADYSLILRFLSNGLQHRLVVGGDYVERTIVQTNFYSNTILDAFGFGMSGNLFQPAVPLPAPASVGVDRPQIRATQTGGYVVDTMRWHLWSLVAGVRFTHIRQSSGGGSARSVPLPQVALTRAIGPHGHMYASWTRGLEFGGEAPLTAENAGSLLSPRRTRQMEVGLRVGDGRFFSLSGAAFQSARPFEFTDPSGASWAGMGRFRSSGEQVHRGLELQFGYALASRISIEARGAWLHAAARGTGVPDYDGVQIQNVPRFRANIRAAVLPETLAGARTSIEWLYVGARHARPDGAATVPGFSRFDAGMQWDLHVGDRMYRWRIAVENLSNRQYWRDAGEAYSANLLFPGSPRRMYLSLLISSF
jgi:iron complex outermembrane recepter protein